MNPENTAPKKTPNSQDALLAGHSSGLVRRYVFPKDTVLFCRGETRHCAFLIDKGLVHIYGNNEKDKEERMLCALGPGEIFGEMALIDNSPRTATAITEDETEIFVIPRDALHGKLTALDPIISLLLSLLIERYRVTRIHMPETIKEDEAGDLIQKLSQYESMPEEIMRLRNVEMQRETALKEMKLEQDIRAGLKEKQFYPVLQPILKLPEETIAGFEALIRWQHPDRGTVMPLDFIPVAERSKLVQHLDRLVLEKVCQILPSLEDRAQGGADLSVSVNLSGVNFASHDVVDLIKETFARTETDPRKICFEITESALIGDPEMAEEILQLLKETGARVALDDFGTGYSSLNYLHRFSIDTIKIDRSFVANLHDAPRSIDIVRAIVGLARNFKLSVVAEGIETEEDVIALNSLGCDYGQGYYYGKPLDLTDAHIFIEKNLANAK